MNEAEFVYHRFVNYEHNIVSDSLKKSIIEAIKESFEEGYKHGFKLANKEAIREIHKNYQPIQ